MLKQALVQHSWCQPCLCPVIAHLGVPRALGQKIMVFGQRKKSRQRRETTSLRPQASGRAGVWRLSLVPKPRRLSPFTGWVLLEPQGKALAVADTDPATWSALHWHLATQRRSTHPSHGHLPLPPILPRWLPAPHLPPQSCSSAGKERHLQS